MSNMLRFQNQMSGAKFSWKSVKILTLPIREQNEVTNSYHQRNWVKKNQFHLLNGEKSGAAGFSITGAV